MYKKYIPPRETVLKGIFRTADNAWIPFETSNSDYDRFKTEIMNDTAQLQDPDGNVLSAEEAKLYVASLP
jgi:hypothetical protein